MIRPVRASPEMGPDRSSVRYSLWIPVTPFRIPAVERIHRNPITAPAHPTSAWRNGKTPKFPEFAMARTAVTMNCIPKAMAREPKTRFPRHRAKKDLSSAAKVPATRFSGVSVMVVLSPEYHPLAAYKGRHEPEIRTCCSEQSKQDMPHDIGPEVDPDGREEPGFLEEGCGGQGEDPVQEQDLGEEDRRDLLERGKAEEDHERRQVAETEEERREYGHGPEDLVLPLPLQDLRGDDPRPEGDEEEAEDHLLPDPRSCRGDEG